MTQHNQEIAQQSPDLFPHERAGYGHETMCNQAGGCHVIVVILDYLIHLISVLRYIDVRSSQKWMVCKAQFEFMCFVRVEIRSK